MSGSQTSAKSSSNDKKPSSAQGDLPSLELMSAALVTLQRLEGLAKSQRQPLPGLSGLLSELLQVRATDCIRWPLIATDCL